MFNAKRQTGRKTDMLKLKFILKHLSSIKKKDWKSRRPVEILIIFRGIGAYTTLL
jgi:hypothetical protein